MKRYFCTYFDINFSPRGLALYQSLVKNSADFVLIVLALDKEVEEQLEVYPNIVVIPVKEYFERWKVDVNKYKTKKELYFSLTAGFCLYVLEKNPKIDILFYLDADIFFFDSVEYLYSDMKDYSIYVTPHKVTPLLKLFMGYYGSYNVGINGFRNDSEGLACLQSWKQDCDSWVPDNVVTGNIFFSDQLYLDKWPSLFPGIKISDNPGINLAPWSVGSYGIKCKGTNFQIKNKLNVVAYHFSDLRRIQDKVWETNSGAHLFSMKSAVRKMYTEYLQIIESYQGTLGTQKYATLKLQRSSFKQRVRELLNKFSGSTIRLPK